MIVVPSASMSTSLWDSSVLWLTANAPVRNEGTTNAIWDCFARYCSGNATQVGTNRQPSRVLTNGTWALKFDGVDDNLYSPSLSLLSGTNGFTIIGRITPQQGVDRNIIGQWNYAATNRQWRIQMTAGTLAFLSSSNGAAVGLLTCSVASNLVPTTAFTFKFTRDGSVGAWKINGTNVASSGDVVTNIASFNPTVVIGGVGNESTVAAYYTGNIEYLQILSGVK